jgi:hypothetical protein
VSSSSSRLPIRSLHRHDPAHPAARIFRVAGIARNQVDMHVHHRLSGGSPVVDADIEAVRTSFNQQQLPHLRHQLEQRTLLFQCCLEERGDVPLRNNEAMAGCHGKAVIEGYGVVVGQENFGLVGDAEWAGVFSFIYFHSIWGGIN